jgi:hypothetical protein
MKYILSEEQRKYKNLCALQDEEQFKVLLMENTKVLCKDGKMEIPKSLQS